MSADAAPNTVFVRNLPFNVSDEQVRCRALRQASRG
jgi:RNA recognition motif-containing protein